MEVGRGTRIQRNGGRGPRFDGVPIHVGSRFSETRGGRGPVVTMT